MRKGLVLIILGTLAWFLFFSSPAQKQRVSALFGGENIIHMTQKAGEPVAPSVVQKLYQPHGLHQDR